MDTTRCGCRRPVEPKTAPEGRVTRHIKLVVTGMGCANCAMRVRNALVSVEGVASVRVSLVPPLCDVLYDGDRAVTEQLVAAVAGAGRGNHHEYRAKPLLQQPDTRS